VTHLVAAGAGLHYRKVVFLSCLCVITQRKDAPAEIPQSAQHSWHKPLLLGVISSSPLFKTSTTHLPHWPWDDTVNLTSLLELQLPSKVSLSTAPGTWKGSGDLKPKKNAITLIKPAQNRTKNQSWHHEGWCECTGM